MIGWLSVISQTRGMVKEDSGSTPHRRRPRYKGKYPRRFEDKYKELDPVKYPETAAKVRASGKTPAGTHVPIMVREILKVLHPGAGDVVVDCTFGHGGHAAELLKLIQPRGRLLALDVDPLELPRAESRLRSMGYGPETLLVRRGNFAGLPKVLAGEGWPGVDCILADLGVSSMQLDVPVRGFSFKHQGPLDMRMNPDRGQPASKLLGRTGRDELAGIFMENADEPHADLLGAALAGKTFDNTSDLAVAVRATLSGLGDEEREKSVRRVFQALRIAVNGEFTALEMLLRHLPVCLNPGGRVAILTFHSGEDRRVKKAFQKGLIEGVYKEIAEEVLRPGPEECGSNPRAASAKLRWARV